MVVLFDEGIHHHQLAEGSAAQLECGIGAGKELELLIIGENEMSPTTDPQVRAQEL